MQVVYINFITTCSHGLLTSHKNAVTLPAIAQYAAVAMYHAYNNYIGVGRYRRLHAKHYILSTSEGTETSDCYILIIDLIAYHAASSYITK